MINYARYPKSLLWFMALLLTFILTGCGGGGGSGSKDSGIQVINQDSAPGAPGTILPGTVPSGTAGTGGTGGPSGTGGTGGTSGAASGPSVISSNPTNGATNVAVSIVGPGNVLSPRTVSATFSQAMNPATVFSAFTVKETISGIGVAGSVSMNAANTIATFTPSAVLASNRQFTAIVTTAATNPAGTALVSGYGWAFTTGAQSGQALINLGTAASFLVLGGNSIDNVSTASNPTRVNGQLGINPGTAAAVTGFTDSPPPGGTGIISTGGIQFGTAVVSQAKTDFNAALSEANTRTLNQVAVGSSDLSSFMVSGGSPGIYPPGLYTSVSSLGLIAGNMTLDAKGDPDAVWVFKAGSSLTVGDIRKIVLINGAKAGNVFWSLGSSSSIGDGVSFKGNILAHSSIDIGTTNGSTVDGRVLFVTKLRLFSSTVNAPAP
ncbi:MAG: ice-binding family protein [Burkholderiaceae bacterium]